MPLTRERGTILCYGIALFIWHCFVHMALFYSSDIVLLLRHCVVHMALFNSYDIGLLICHCLFNDEMCLRNTSSLILYKE